MARHTINVSLSENSIQKAIRQLQQYKSWLVQKTEQFVRELAEIGIPVIDENMAKASYTYDEKGIRSGSDTSHYTHVELSSSVQASVARATLVVEGKELLFIEFGAGVCYNGEADTSPHPKGQEFSFLIGSYGEGHGAQKMWGYYADSGELIRTRGVEAQMPVYKAEKEIKQKYIEVARKVFS